MKAFKNNFSTPSVQDWLQKAEKDLKGKSLATLSWDWGNDMIFSPVHFKSQENDTLTYSSPKTPWTIGEKFTILDPKSSNQAILAALNQGLEGIHLDIQRDLSIADWTALLDQVALPYIDTLISFSSTQQSSIDHLAAYIDTNSIPWESKQLILCCTSPWSAPHLFQSCMRSASSFSIDTGRPATHLSKQLLSAENTLQLLLQSGHTPTSHIFKVQLHQSFYHNIIGIQALKILWQNILDANQLDPHTPLYILAYTDNKPSIDENTQKIDATVQAISAVVAGVNYYEVNASDPTLDTDFNRRIHRNIQHLLKLESFMDHVTNPTEGAYFFDHLTRELAQTTWSKFQHLTPA